MENFVPRMSWKTIKEVFIATDGKKMIKQTNCCYPHRTRMREYGFFLLYWQYFQFLRTFDDQKTGLEAILGQVWVFNHADRAYKPSLQLRFTMC